jgi:hypothetical protein
MVQPYRPSHVVAMRAFRADEWPSVRARGKRAFLLRYGLLGRGLPLGALVALVIEAGLGGAFPAALWSPSFLGRLLLCVAVFSVTGCVNANVTWNAHEKREARRG